MLYFLPMNKIMGDYRIFVGAFPTSELAERIQAVRLQHDAKTACITAALAVTGLVIYEQLVSLKPAQLKPGSLREAFEAATLRHGPSKRTSLWRATGKPWRRCKRN